MSFRLHKVHNNDTQMNPSVLYIWMPIQFCWWITSIPCGIFRSWHTGSNFTFGKTTGTTGWSIFCQDPFQSRLLRHKLLLHLQHLLHQELVLLLPLLQFLLQLQDQFLLLCHMQFPLDLHLQRMIPGTVVWIEERKSKPSFRSWQCSLSDVWCKIRISEGQNTGFRVIVAFVNEPFSDGTKEWWSLINWIFEFKRNKIPLNRSYSCHFWLLPNVNHVM